MPRIKAGPSLIKKATSALSVKGRPVFRKAPVSKKLLIGICAMENKSRSKPMKQILNRLEAQNFFQIIVFTNEMLNRPIEDWPRVDGLLAFYSTGFPLEKAIEYSKKYNPFLINDLEMQRTIRDREQIIHFSAVLLT
eukprot:sb/3474510/